VVCSYGAQPVRATSVAAARAAPCLATRFIIDRAPSSFRATFPLLLNET
jgi:hypothetical protein